MGTSIPCIASSFRSILEMNEKQLRSRHYSYSMAHGSFMGFLFLQVYDKKQWVSRQCADNQTESWILLWKLLWAVIKVK